jgi:hypothetical protein
MELSRSWGRGRRTSVGCDDDEAALATEILSKLDVGTKTLFVRLFCHMSGGRLAMEGTRGDRSQSVYCWRTPLMNNTRRSGHRFFYLCLLSH